MSDFWIQVNGEIDGPFPESEILRRIQAGQVATTDLVCEAGRANWQSAVEFLAVRLPPKKLEIAVVPPQYPAPAVVQTTIPPIIETSIQIPVVPANAFVCTRCRQWGWGKDEAPVNYSGVSFGRRGVRYSVGSRRRSQPKLICAGCGSATLVPAGSPRGQELLEKQGLQVGNEQRRPASFGCAALIICGLVVLMLSAVAKGCAKLN